MRLLLDNVCKAYDGKIAVEGLNLEVPEGRIYGIIGPNGAGKTTTIRMIMNITMPDSGRITIDGKERTADFVNRVGYLPEERGLYKKMTVSEILVYLGQLKDCSSDNLRSDMDEWLKRMNLLQYKERKVEELSKGMQQKLQFISTILHDPDLIILDELFSGLDPLNIELIKNVLLELKEAGKTILFSTHVMEQAEKLCDYVCMIHNGHSVIDGKMAEVKARFGKNAIQVDLEGDAGFVADIAGVKNVTEFNNYVELQLEDGVDSNHVLRSIADRVAVRRFEVVEPSLYNIFIDMARLPADAIQTPGGGDHV
ncbi:MAG: ATP-binding cassette domain-containing protein [bacterium]